MRNPNISGRPFRPPKLPFMLILLGAAIFFFAGSCGMYHEADIAGYVRNSATGVGVNGAVLKVYLTEEDAASGEGYLVETSSMVYNGNYGYFNYAIIWQKLFAAYGSEGDSVDIWITAEHDDYASKTVQVKGINSDTMNVVPDIQLDAVVYTAQQVSGLIWDGTTVTGTGIPVGKDGVRVTLDLASTEKNPDYYAVSTSTEIGESIYSGVYTFINVKWRDEDNPGQTTDEETVTIQVDDPNYTGSQVLERSITSGTGVMFMDQNSAIDAN